MQQVRRWVPYGVAGIVAWVALALVAGLIAHRRSVPVLPTIVTWDEWVAAVLLLPAVARLVVGAVQRDPEAPRRDRPGIVVGAALTALTVFTLDLATRALFGLGWKPF